MNFDIPIEPHTDTAQALYRLLRQVQNWAEETHPDKGIKSPLEQARYQVAMYGDLLPQIVWWNSVCAQVGALRGLPPGKKQIEQLLEAFRGGPQGKRGKQHGQMVQRRWNELKATGEHVTEKETEAAGAVPSAPFPYPAGYQEVGAAVEASTAIPPGNTLGRFVYPKVQGVLQESKPFSFSEINIAGKPAGLLLEDVDLYDIGKIQNAISVLRERRQDDPTTLMYVLISVPTAYQALKVGNTLGATHAETWLRQHALTQLKVTTTPTKPPMMEISAEPFDLNTHDDTLIPLEGSGAVPANDWYFPKPELFGMQDTPETRQGMQQLDELITSFVAGFTGWEQMYHRKEGNQLETAEDYEVRLQKLVSWLYARLCPKLQAVLLKEPWPALPQITMRPWAPTEDVEVKLDSVVEAPQAPIVGVDWGTEETEGMRKRRAAFSPPGEELPDPLDPVLYNSEITGADTGMEEQSSADVSAIEPEPRTGVKETLGSLPLAAAGMFGMNEPGKTWQEVLKAKEEHDAALAAVCAKSALGWRPTLDEVRDWALPLVPQFETKTGLTPTHVLLNGIVAQQNAQVQLGRKLAFNEEVRLCDGLMLAPNDPPGRRELVDRPPTTDGIFLAHQRADGVFLTALDSKLKAVRQDLPGGKRVYRCAVCQEETPWLDTGEDREAWLREHNLTCGKVAG